MSVPLAGGAGTAHTAPQLGLSAGLPSGLSLTRHSLDLKLARDLQLGMEAREPQRPSMEGVGSFPGERGWVRHVWGVWAQAVKGGNPQVTPPSQETPHFCSICHFNYTLISICLCYAQCWGHCIVIVSLCLCLPLRFILSLSIY